MNCLPTSSNRTRWKLSDWDMLESCRMDYMLTDQLKSDSLETLLYKVFFVVTSPIKLTDQLKSDSLETFNLSLKLTEVSPSAYRLAQIGLVGNFSRHISAPSSGSNAYRLAQIGLVGNSLLNLSLSASSTIAYRLAQIGLVGNSEFSQSYGFFLSHQLTDQLKSDSLETHVAQHTTVAREA